MYISKLFIPLLKEVPSEAKIKSHQIMLRAGMIKQSSTGIYSWLPLGFKIMKKIEQILFDISQSFPRSTGFERLELQYSYEIYAREKEELQPLRDKLVDLLKQYDITIKIESLSDQINEKVSNVAPNAFSPKSSPSASNPPPVAPQ